VNPTWQRNELIKAFERINKSKDVKKGKAAAIQAIPLESTDEPDTDVRDKECGFVLHTNLVEVLQAGDHKIGVPHQAQLMWAPPQAILGHVLRLSDCHGRVPVDARRKPRDLGLEAWS
jgi:hypothetical protein